jgi:DNA-binding Lrp family transcriptional regulator
MKLPIVKIAELTGIPRDTISKRLADLPFEAGKKGAKLYSSEDALAAIYKTDSLEAARAEQARTAAQLNAIRAEDLRKTRIPIGIVLQVNDEIAQATAATLKAAEGKFLTQDLINDIFDKFRSIPSLRRFAQT